MISGSFPDGTFLVEHISGSETLGDPFTIELYLLSESPDQDVSALVGDTVTLTIEGEAGPGRFFNGYVTRMALTGTFDKYARYHLTVRPWFWMLSGRENSRVFQEQSVTDIAKTLFREHGFSDFEDSLSGNYPVKDFVVQYRESDFAFISRLFEHAGIYYYFRHEAGRHVLVLADSISAHATIPGYETVGFHPEGQANPEEAEYINSWELVHQWRSGAFVTNEFDFQRPRASLMASLQATAQHKMGDLEVFDYPGGYDDQGEGQDYARSRLEELQKDVEVAHGAGDVRGIGAGTVFSLIDYPAASQNKQYLIVAASYDAANPAHDSGNDSAGYFHFSFTAADSKVPFRPALATPRPRVEGVQTAIVVGPSGEEIWTDKYGRVKVQFHWDREGKDDENSSCWVRVAQLWAGSGWGGVHIPRIGQEVIVDFLEGDPDRPIITGRVYNADNMPPYDLPANQTQSGIKSHSTKEGGLNNFNELRFEDKKGSEEVYVQAEKDLDTLVKNDETRSVGHDRSTDVSNDETVNVGNNRTEKVGKDETITIGNNRTESVGKAETVSIGTTRTHSVGTDETLSVGGARTASVGKDESISVAANQTVSIGKNLSLDVGGARTLTIGKDDTINVDGKLTVSVAKDEAREVGKTLTVNAADSITFVSGDASIVLKKDGTVTIKGKDISLNASGKLNLIASSDITIKGSKVQQN
jgi:type VI secretion system secreted protein VgrG